MTHNEKIVEAVARALAQEASFDPDATYNISVPVIVSGRLTDTGHDTRITEKRDRVTAPAWHRFSRAARAAITAHQAEAWQDISTAPKDGDEILAIDGRLAGGFPQVVYWDIYPKSGWHQTDANIIYHPEAFTHWRRDCLLPPVPNASQDRSEP